MEENKSGVYWSGLINWCGLAGVHAIIRGFVFYKMWGWFMVNHLHLPPISLIASFGMMIMVRFVMVRFPTVTDIIAAQSDSATEKSLSSKEYFGFMISGEIGMSLFALMTLFGAYIIQLWM